MRVQVWGEPGVCWARLGVSPVCVCAKDRVTLRCAAHVGTPGVCRVVTPGNAHLQSHTGTHVHLDTHICVHLDTHTRVGTLTDVCTVDIYTHTHMCTGEHTHAHTHTCVHRWAHTQSHTYTLRCAPGHALTHCWTRTQHVHTRTVHYGGHAAVSPPVAAHSPPPLALRPATFPRLRRYSGECGTGRGPPLAAGAARGEAARRRARLPLAGAGKRTAR